MLPLILIIGLFYLTGIISFPALRFNDFVLLYFNGKAITLKEALVFLLLLVALKILPSPLKQIASVAFFLWILSTVGVILIGGFSNLLVSAVIIGLIIYIFRSYYD